VRRGVVQREPRGDLHVLLGLSILRGADEVQLRKWGRTENFKT
jgi:hypothetical protein